jgi:hypothetical protein
MAARPETRLWDIGDIVMLIDESKPTLPLQSLMKCLA